MNKTHCQFNSVTRIEAVNSIYPTQDDKLHFPKKLNVCSGCLLLFLFFYKVYSYFYWIRNHTIFIWMSMPLSLLPLLIFSKLNDRLTLENYWYFLYVCVTTIAPYMLMVCAVIHVKYLQIVTVFCIHKGSLPIIKGRKRICFCISTLIYK